MRGLPVNALLGLGLGRFGSVWWDLVFTPIVAGELADGVYVHYLGLNVGCARRAVASLACDQFGFLLGALLRPLRGETWKRFAPRRLYRPYAESVRSSKLSRRAGCISAHDDRLGALELPQNSGGQIETLLMRPSLGQRLSARSGPVAVLLGVLFVAAAWIGLLG